MTTERQKPIRVDRRTTIKWLAATMVAANTGCSSTTKFVGEEIPPAPRVSTRLEIVPNVQDFVGYGTDPDLMNPVLPWARTMTTEQLRTSAALCDAILPADDKSPSASAVGVPDFIDEWVSAPYPQQQDDREIILGGLEALDRQSQIRFGVEFASAGQAQTTELIDSIAFADQASAEHVGLVKFFERFRYLTVGAYYTTEAGTEDIGYIGNVPISGDYPGPSDAAMAHLAGVLDQLGLSLPD